MGLNGAQIACIAASYDAVLDPSSVGAMLDRFAHAMDAASAAALVADPRHPELEVFAAGSLYAPHEITDYIARFGAEEAEAIAHTVTAPPTRWIRDEEAFSRPLDQYDHTRFLAERFGIGRRVIARINDDAGWLNAISLHYPLTRGPITAAETAFAAPLLPHFERMFALHRPFQMLRARFAAVIGALDRLHLGVAIAAQTGEIILRNREADRILALQDGLTLRDQRLQAGRSEGTRALAAHIAQAVATASERGAAGVARIVIPRPSGADGFLVEIDALRGARDELEPGLRGALIILIDPEHRAPVRIDGVQDLYGLSPAEAAVLAALLDGLAAPDIADARNTSVATVRTQLRAIAEKTRAPNRAALVRLTLSLNPPIDHPAPHDAPKTGG